MKKSIIIWTFAIILVAIAVYTTYQYNNNPIQTPPPSSQRENPSNASDQSSAEGEVLDSIDALDFSLEDMSGNKVNLADYKGKNIYLNFWASWCGPCKDEMPFIEQLYQDTKDTDFVIITVNLDQSKSIVSDFMTENKYTFPVWIDPQGEVAEQYGVSGIPLSLLINRDFKIISAHEGSMLDYKMLKEFVDQVNK